MPTLELAIDARKAQQGADQFGTAVNRAADKARDAQGRFVKAKESLDNVGKSADSAGRLLAQFAAALGLAGAAHQAISAIASFEKTMQTLKGVTKSTDSDMKQFAATARELGATTVFSATEAGDAILTLAKAGFTANEAVEATSGVLSLAAAEGIGMADAAQIMTNTLKQFGLQASDSARVADVLMQASIGSATGATQLGAALSYSGTIARTVGVGFEETTASLALLAGSGLEADRAGTGLRGVLESLVNPTGKAKEALEKYVKNVNEVNPSIVGLEASLRRLKDANLAPGDLFKVFGTNAAPAAQSLISQVDALKPMVDTLNNAKGAAKELAATVNNSLSGAWSNFTSAVEEAYLQVGDAGLLGGLRKIVDFSTEVMQVFLGMGDHVSDAAKQFARISEAVAVGVGSVGALAAAFVALNAIMAINPIFLIPTAVAAAVAAFWYFKDSMVEVGDSNASVTDLIVATWEVLKSTLIEYWKIFIEYYHTQIKWLGDTWRDLVNFFSDNWEGGWTVMKDTLKTVANSIMGTLNGIGETIGVVIGRLWALVSALGDMDFSSWEKMKASAAAVGKSIADAVSPTGFMNDIKGVWENTYKTDYVQIGVDMADTLIEGFKSSDFVAELKLIVDQVGKTWDEKMKEISDRAIMRKNERIFRQAIAGWTGGAGPSTATGGVQPAPFIPNIAPEEAVEVDKRRLREIERAREQFEQMFIDMRTERDLMFATNQEREIELQLRNARRLAEEGEIADRETKLKLMEKEFRLLQNARELKKIANGVGDAFGSAFEDIAFGAKTAGEAMKGFYEQVSRMVFNQMVTQPFSQAISGGLGSFMQTLMSNWGSGGGTTMSGGPQWNGATTMQTATGGAFMPGSGFMPIPTTSDALYSFGGNRVGSIAEAQPETVMPLTNGPQGMGVRMYGGGGGGNIYNFNFHGVTQMDTFRRSQGQMSAWARSAIGGKN